METERQVLGSAFALELRQQLPLLHQLPPLYHHQPLSGLMVAQWCHLEFQYLESNPLVPSLPSSLVADESRLSSALLYPVLLSTPPPRTASEVQTPTIV